MDKQKLKCAIGATLLTPLSIAAFFAGVFGCFWLFRHYPIAEMIGTIIIGMLLIFAIGFFVTGIWLSFYSHCIEHKSKEKK